MSIKAMSWIWENSKQKGSKLLMLLAIADRCDDHGVCYPGHKRLAEKARISKAAVSKNIKSLEVAGELVVVVHGGIKTTHGKTNKYYLKQYRDSLGLPTKDGNREQYKRHDGTLGNEKHGAYKTTPQEAYKTTPQEAYKTTPYTSVDTSVDTSEKDIPPTSDGNASIEFNTSTHSNTLQDYIDGKQCQDCHEIIHDGTCLCDGKESTPRDSSKYRTCGKCKSFVYDGEACKCEQVIKTANLDVKPTMAEVDAAIYGTRDNPVIPGDSIGEVVAPDEPPAPAKTKKQKRDELYEAIIAAMKLDKSKLTSKRKKSIGVAMSELFGVDAKPYEMAWLVYFVHKKFDGKYSEHALAKYYADFCASPEYEQAQRYKDDPIEKEDDTPKPAVVPATPEQIELAERLMKEILERD